MACNCSPRSSPLVPSRPLLRPVATSLHATAQLHAQLRRQASKGAKRAFAGRGTAEDHGAWRTASRPRRMARVVDGGWCGSMTRYCVLSSILRSAVDVTRTRRLRAGVRARERQLRHIDRRRQGHVVCLSMCLS